MGVEDDVDYQQEGIEDEEDTDVRMLEDSEEEEDEEEGVAMQVEDDLEEASADFGGDLKRKLPVELISQDEPSKKKKKRKKSEKCLVCGEKGHRKMDCTRLPEERRKELQDLYNMKVEIYFSFGEDVKKTGFFGTLSQTMGRWGSKVLNFLVKITIQLFLLQTRFFRTLS